MNRYQFILASVVFLSLAAESVCAQNTGHDIFRNETGIPYIENFRPDDYDANPMNWGIVRDNRGILYVANLNTILEFDGVSWRSIRVPKDSWVLSIACDSAGTIYAGLFGNFGYLAADSTGTLHFVSLLDHVNAADRGFTEIWRIHCTKTGIWFRSSNKIFLWSGNKMKVLRAQSAFSLTSVLDDTLYVVEHGIGLEKTTGDSLILIEDSRRLLPLGFINILPYDGKQKLFVSRKGLYLFNGHKFSPFNSSVKDFLKGKTLSSAVILPGEKYALATYQGGACVMDHAGNILYFLNKLSGLADDDVKNLYVDRSGNLWLALNSGLARIPVWEPATFFTERRGLKGNVVSIVRHKGTIYAATSQAVYYLESGTGLNIPLFKPVRGVNSQGFWLLSLGNNLLAATAEGVLLIDGHNAYSIGAEKEGAFVLSCSSRDSSLVYAGLKNGLEILRYGTKSWMSTGKVKGIDEEIRTIVEDADGTLWLGTVFQGAMKVEITNRDNQGWNAAIQHFNAKNGLPDGPVNISKIDGQIVFATNKGLRRYDKQKNYFVPDSDLTTALGDTTLSAPWIEQDQFGHVFVWPQRSGKKTAFWVLVKDPAGHYVIKKQRFKTLSHFGDFHTTFTDVDSILWIGCSTGLVRYDLWNNNNFLKDNQALIRRVLTIESDSTLFGGFSAIHIRHHVLSYADNALRFEYAIPYFENRLPTRYQYQLQGFDNSWSNWTMETKKDYTNLKPGVYTFEVRAKNDNTARDIDETLSQTDAFSFEILPPWYLNRIAFIVYILLVAAALYTFYRIMRTLLIKRELKKAELREAEIISLKNKELEEKNKQLEEILSLLQTAQNSLIESESRFRSVAESANDAVITADEAGNITFWNKRAETIFGYTREEILGKPLTVLMPDRFHEAHLRGLERFRSTGKVNITGLVTDIQAVNKKGDEFPIELSLADWESHDGKYITGIVRDVTRRKQEEETLRNTREQLFQSEKMSTLGKLSAGMAHELNNPVASAKRSAAHMRKVFIDLQIAYLKMSKLDLSGDQKEALMDIAQRAKDCAEKPVSLDPAVRSDKEQEIEKWLENYGLASPWELAPSLVSLGYDTKEMTELTKKFPLPQFSIVFNWQSALYMIYSLLSEIDLGTERISEIVKAFKTYTYMDRAPMQKVDIHKDLNNTLIIFSSKLKDGVTVVREFDDNLPAIEAYGSELNQVWTNLVDNALDAMDGKGQLILRTYKKDKDVTVEVEDDGPGIPGENQSRIFDPFYTTKAVGKGTGMGLSICHNIIVHRHHGRIKVFSEPGRTCFTVSLPGKPPQSQPA